MEAQAPTTADTLITLTLFARSGRSKGTMKRNSPGKAAEVIAFLRANSDESLAAPKAKRKKSVANSVKKTARKKDV